MDSKSDDSKGHNSKRVLRVTSLVKSWISPPQCENFNMASSSVPAAATAGPSSKKEEFPEDEDVLSDDLEESIPSEKKILSEEDGVQVVQKSLSASQKAHIERNRQKALLLRQSRLTAKSFQNKVESKNLMKVSAKEIDTGAGFFMDEEDELELKNKKVEYIKGPAMTNSKDLLCEDCGQLFVESYLHNHFKKSICNKCREDHDDKHNLITKSDAKTKYLLKDVDFDKREPILKFIIRKNPHNQRWGDMKLYLESQVFVRAMEIWESEENIEKAKDLKCEKQNKMKKKKFDKKMKELRMTVRSSLWRKQTENHQHTFGEETYDEEEDTYSKTCSTCDHVMSYEKM